MTNDLGLMLYAPCEGPFLSSVLSRPCPRYSFAEQILLSRPCPREGKNTPINGHPKKKLRHWSFIYLNYSFHIQKLQFKYLVLGEDLVEEGESLHFNPTFYFLSHSFLLPLFPNSVATAVV